MKLDPDTPPEVLARLAKDPKVTVRRAVAWNPNTPPEVLAQLARDSNVGVRSGAARNPSTPSTTLIRLVRDPSKTVRYEVAWNPNAPPEALAQLANDPDPRIRCRVAEHHNTPPEILARLANDRSISVRYTVMENPNTSPEILAKFTRVVTVRLCYEYKTKAVQTVVPESGPVTIFTDDNLRLRLVPLSLIPGGLMPGAIKRGQCAIALLGFVGTRTNEQISKDRLERLASLVRPKTTTPSTSQLLTNTTFESEVEAALDPNTPPEVLAQLANNSDAQVRMLVAQNPNAPPKTLAQLINDPDVQVRMLVTQNSSTPVEILAEFAQVVTVQFHRGCKTKAVLAVIPDIGPVTVFTDKNLKVRPIHPELLSPLWGKKKIVHEQGIIAVEGFIGTPANNNPVPKDRLEQLIFAVQLATPEIPQPLTIPIESEGVEFVEEPTLVPVTSEGEQLPEEPKFKTKPLGTVRLAALAAPFDVFNGQTGLLSYKLKGTNLTRFVFGDPVPMTPEIKQKLQTVPKIPKDRVPGGSVPHMETNGTYVYALWYPFEEWEYKT